MLKIVGAIIVVSATSMLGITFANCHWQRVRELRDLQFALRMLETEIGYTFTPLPIALERIGKKMQTVFKDLFLQTRNFYVKSGELTMEEAWEKALGEIKSRAALKNPQIEVLSELGKCLGVSNKEDQLKYITLTADFLKNEEIAAREAQQKYGKMYKYLGFLGGLVLVILIY